MSDCEFDRRDLLSEIEIGFRVEPDLITEGPSVSVYRLPRIGEIILLPVEGKPSASRVWRVVDVRHNVALSVPSRPNTAYVQRILVVVETPS